MDTSGNTLLNFSVGQHISSFLLEGNTVVASSRYYGTYCIFDIRNPVYQKLNLALQYNGPSYRSTPAAQYNERNQHDCGLVHPYLWRQQLMVARYKNEIDFNNNILYRFHHIVLWNLGSLKWDAVIVPKETSELLSFCANDSGIIVNRRPRDTITGSFSQIVELWN